jgi:hypothetical protein
VKLVEKREVLRFHLLRSWCHHRNIRTTLQIKDLNFVSIKLVIKLEYQSTDVHMDWLDVKWYVDLTAHRLRIDKLGQFKFNRLHTECFANLNILDRYIDDGKRHFTFQDSFWDFLSLKCIGVRSLKASAIYPENCLTALSTIYLTTRGMWPLLFGGFEGGRSPPHRQIYFGLVRGYKLP